MEVGGRIYFAGTAGIWQSVDAADAGDFSDWSAAAVDQVYLCSDLQTL